MTNIHKRKKTIIGILAGMGPKSTSPFLDLVIEQCQKQYGARHDIDFPHMLIYSLPTPFYVDRLMNEEEMEKTIRGGLKKLESAGAGFIAMPCNSAHKYFDNLKNYIHIPLLNIVETTIKKLNKSTRRATLFATPTTISSNLYQSKFAQEGIEVILKDEWQKNVNDLISNVKAGVEKESLLQILRRLAKYLEDDKVDTIVIACTDLTKIVKEMQGFTVIDSSEALAEETVKVYLDSN